MRIFGEKGKKMISLLPTPYDPLCGSDQTTLTINKGGGNKRELVSIERERAVRILSSPTNNHKRKDYVMLLFSLFFFFWVKLVGEVMISEWISTPLTLFPLCREDQTLGIMFPLHALHHMGPPLPISRFHAHEIGKKKLELFKEVTQFSRPL